MHVLYLHQYFVPPDGIGGTRSYEMARRLVQAGHRVTLVTSSAAFPEHYGIARGVKEIDLEGIRLVVIDVPYSNRLSNLRRILAFLSFAVKSLLASLRVGKVDVVFATSTPLTIAIPAIVAKFRHRCPMVFEVRDLWPELPIAVGALRNPVLKALAVALERVAYGQSSHVVALSPGMKDGVVGTGFPAGKVTVISNSCDVELFRQECKKEPLAGIKGDHDQPVVLYAGTLGPINGAEYLVDIAEAMLVINPKVRFVVAGDGRQREVVREKARRQGVLEKNFWLLPPVAKKEMPELLGASSVACSLFVDIPAMWHNSANKFFDGLAAGRPVLINYQGWQAALLADTGAGLVVPPGDPVAAAGLLNDFLSDDRRMHQAREAAKALADHEFNRDVLFAKLHEVLKSVLPEVGVRDETSH